MTDIHGDCKGMDILLKHAEVDLHHDQLILGGDMINRGRDSAGVVKRIKELVDEFPDNVHALIGNHEEMMGDYFRTGDQTWLRHGGHDTIQNFMKSFPNENVRMSHMEWAYSLPLYFEDDQFVYTHSGLHPYEPLNKQRREILWMSESDFYNVPKDDLLTLTNGKPVVHGHTPIERIYFDGVRMNCDLGSNTYVIEEDRALGLVNLSEMTYLAYNPSRKKSEKRKVLRF
jgi:serine/threonine protein phosphatase 1